MIRRIIHIDQDKCNGCGACARACHEGAIDMVDGKARLMREHYCDGLGDCLPACPTGAITFEIALPIIMGIAIGAAVPVLLSALGANVSGKRTAFVYLLIDVLGVVIWATVFYIANAIAHFDFMTMTMTTTSTSIITIITARASATTPPAPAITITTTPTRCSPAGARRPPSSSPRRISTAF